MTAHASQAREHGDLAKGNEPCIGRAKTTGVEVERPELGIEIDMEPFAPGGASPGRGGGDQFAGEAAATERRRHHGVEHEGMHAAVPGDVDEASHRSLVR